MWMRRFEAPAFGCAPATASVHKYIGRWQLFSMEFWRSGVGADNVSTDINPSHFYAAPGTYTVTMIATDLQYL